MCVCSSMLCVFSCVVVHGFAVCLKTLEQKRPKDCNTNFKHLNTKVGLAVQVMCDLLMSP